MKNERRFREWLHVYQIMIVCSATLQNWNKTACSCLLLKNLTKSFHNTKLNLRKGKDAPLGTCEPRRSTIRLQKSVAKKHTKSDKMENENGTLKEQIGKQEQYSSNDTNNIKDSPIWDIKKTLLGNVLHFFRTFMDYKRQIADIRACHHLPKPESKNYCIR